MMQDQACDLPQWFTRADRIGMAESVEARVPFCTTKIFSMANSIPYQLRTLNNERKAVLKKVAEKYLDRELIYRKKIGFATPLAEWMDSKKGWGQLLRDTLTSKSFKSRQFVDKEHFNSFHKPFQKGKYSEKQCGWLWTYLNLELWHQIYFEGGWKNFSPLKND